MKHGHVFTITVLKKLPEGSTSSIICIKSDNCLSKCKCKYVFKSYLSLAPEISKFIIAFYSTSGHGKRLVNAMSSFSVKYPFQVTVLLKYFLYGTSEDIFNYLKTIDLNDQQKKYCVITQDETDIQRKNLKGS